MNKKAGWLIAALMLVCSTSSFAVGLGLQYSGNAGKIYTNGIAINVKLDDRPMVFAASYYIDDDKSFGLTGDYWLFEKTHRQLGRIQNQLVCRRWFVPEHVLWRRF